MWKPFGRGGIAVLGLAVLWGSPAWGDEVVAPSIPVAQEACVGSLCSAKAEDPKPAEVGPVNWKTQRRIPGVSPFVNGTGYWGASRKPGYD